jgi:hypothetical protein
MPKLNDTLAPAEHAHFARLSGHHPRAVGVRTHRDALSYLLLIDAFRRKQKGGKNAQVMQRTQMRQPGLLGLVMEGRHG